MYKETCLQWPELFIIYKETNMSVSLSVSHPLWVTWNGIGLDINSIHVQITKARKTDIRDQRESVLCRELL